MSDLILFSDFSEGMWSIFMAKKLLFTTPKNKTFADVYSDFIISQSAKGVSEPTLRNYRQVLHNISRFFDIDAFMDEISKRDVERMVAGMRSANLAHNTVATYNRVVKTFLNWCRAEGIANISVPTIKEKDVVKETYSDVCR